MGLYLTEYDIPGGTGVKTTLFASDYHHARRLCDQRAIGERLVKPTAAHEDNRIINAMRPEMPSDLVRRRRFTDALHACMFLSFIGQASGVLTYRDLFTDLAPVHELSHWVLYQGWAYTSLHKDWAPAMEEVVDLACKLERLELRVPGFHPHSVDLYEPKAPPLEARTVDTLHRYGFAVDYPLERRITKRLAKKREGQMARLEEYA